MYVRNASRGKPVRSMSVSISSGVGGYPSISATKPRNVDGVVVDDPVVLTPDERRDRR